MQNTLDALVLRVPAPQRVPMLDSFAFRFAEKSIHQAMVQKLARLISGLTAARVLLEAGLLQELGAIQRMLDEFNEDINFLAVGVIYGEVGDLHHRYLEAFYKEEFNKPEDPIGSDHNRDMVPRKKIRAFIASSKGSEGIEPTQTLAAGRTLSKAYSGYVHGASPQIMEMYGGTPPKFRPLEGRQSSLFEDHQADLWNYFYRGIMSFGMVAKAFGDDALFDRIHRYVEHFEASAPR